MAELGILSVPLENEVVNPRSLQACPKSFFSGGECLVAGSAWFFASLTTLRCSPSSSLQHCTSEGSRCLPLSPQH